MDPLIGDRVVIRYRLGAGGPDDWRAGSGPNPAFTHAPTLSDITGILREHDGQALVIERDGRAESVPVAAITSLRQLSAQTVRNSQIRRVERALTDATVAAERVEVDGWVLSADPASSAPRATAAVPLGFGTNTTALDTIAEWYRLRGLPTRVIAPERLLRLADLGAGPGIGYEVLTRDGTTPVEVPGSDLDERRRLRAEGYGLHHTFMLLTLPGSAAEAAGASADDRR
ncbi:hypothetical protein GOHSU_14_01700 [Gordonia hirsuta DSM 44140 = NBRC 16056]|uniref:Histone acetyltransferase Rv0428c-like C-terminal domain-containing protein n=1 Tax=Gordonia hirsuta DSM 44140 = NBRC 16056 TaxID=1121927 RepID=L7LAG5_9ACTN|nr:hypothetical protein [Gordonia hirsuta]GAC57003.1 hypothetical protein GOHSU_14_01700 [Gordonia hirsuta DSM 44140 = NBRC 16056]